MARNLVNSFVNSPCPTGNLDQTIHDLGACYPWVIYVQGNLYLRNYYNQVGAAVFWRGVANYYAANRFGMGGTRELLNALDAAAGVKYPHQDCFPSLDWEMYLPEVANARRQSSPACLARMVNGAPAIERIVSARCRHVSRAGHSQQD
jgi:hypothetical protein